MHWLGRVDFGKAEGPRFGWQGTGFRARVRGSRMAVRLRSERGDIVFFQPVVDGRLAPRFSVYGDAPSVVEIARDLAPTEHVVELYRETEGQFGATVFLGFAEGEVLEPPPAAPRRIEAIGDSITAGYGNLGREEHSEDAPTNGCPWSAENSSWYRSYAAIAARALGAELTSIARSGWGVLPSSRPEPNRGLPSVYEHALGVDGSPPWTFSEAVDAVIINLGTNDWIAGDPGKAYERAYVAFVKRIRKRHPDAFVFLTIGSMLIEPELSEVNARLARVVATLAREGDRKVSTFDLGTQDARITGCDWHPSEADHARMARILEEQLRAKLAAR